MNNDEMDDDKVEYNNLLYNLFDYTELIYEITHWLKLKELLYFLSINKDLYKKSDTIFKYRFLSDFNYDNRVKYVNKDFKYHYIGWFRNFKYYELNDYILYDIGPYIVSLDNIINLSNIFKYKEYYNHILHYIKEKRIKVTDINVCYDLCESFISYGNNNLQEFKTFIYSHYKRNIYFSYSKFVKISIQTNNLELLKFLLIYDKYYTIKYPNENEMKKVLNNINIVKKFIEQNYSDDNKLILAIFDHPDLYIDKSISIFSQLTDPKLIQLLLNNSKKMYKVEKYLCNNYTVNDSIHIQVLIGIFNNLDINKQTYILLQNKNIFNCLFHEVDKINYDFNYDNFSVIRKYAFHIRWKINYDNYKHDRFRSSVNIQKIITKLSSEPSKYSLLIWASKKGLLYIIEILSVDQDFSHIFKNNINKILYHAENNNNFNIITYINNTYLIK